jgi:hypothetical protein
MERVNEERLRKLTDAMTFEGFLHSDDCREIAAMAEEILETRAAMARWLKMLK